MKVAGIIAEYNPFHNGHAYHIEEVRRKTGADYVIAIMSGNFVQRGGPAIVDKYTRTKMALLSGADLVIELPVVAATASAETFARTGVSILAATGIVTHLGFGCETNDLQLLDSLATLFSEEPANYQELLSSYIKEGLSYPSARARAAGEIFSQMDVDLESILNNPNNILAIEYLKALKQLELNIQPCPILRQGNQYHASDLTGDMSSATAIRSHIIDSSSDTTYVWSQFPEQAGQVLKQYFENYCPVEENDFSTLLHYKLHLAKGSFSDYYDCKGALANRITNYLESYTTFSDFVDVLKTKNQTYTGISRILTHVLLDIKEEHAQHLKATDFAPYIRVLGFRKEANTLLTALKASSIPIITKLADGQQEILSLGADDALAISRNELLQTDITSSQIYDVARTARTGAAEKNEYRKSLIYI